MLFWHRLTREEDYAFGRPSLTCRKLSALELKTEGGWRRGRYSGPRVHETKKEREDEREFSEQVETAYRRLAQKRLSHKGGNSSRPLTFIRPPTPRLRGLRPYRSSSRSG